MTQTLVSEDTLRSLVARIVQAVHPKRVLLFGSAARGQVGPHSDLDLLLVMPDGTHRRHTAQAAYLALTGFGVAKDIVVVTETDVRDLAGNPSLILSSALREGRELYAAG